MKVSISIFLLMGFAFTAYSQQNTPTESTSFLINFLDVSYEQTEKTLASIEEELWQYKPHEEIWSIAECMEHIVSAEKILLGQMSDALETPPNTEKILSARDGLVIAFTVDRGKKVKTRLEPQEITKTKEAYLEALSNSREKIKAFVLSNQDVLRNHFGQAPFGEVDVYQLALVIGAHGLRHTAQMKEIIADYTGKAVEY